MGNEYFPSYSMVRFSYHCKTNVIDFTIKYNLILTLFYFMGNKYFPSYSMVRFSYHCKTNVIYFTTIIDAGHLSIYFVMSHATSYNSHNVTLLNQSISNLLTCKLSTLCVHNGLLGINFSTHKFQSTLF